MRLTLEAMSTGTPADSNTLAVSELPATWRGVRPLYRNNKQIIYRT